MADGTAMVLMMAMQWSFEKINLIPHVLGGHCIDVIVAIEVPSVVNRNNEESAIRNRGYHWEFQSYSPSRHRGLGVG